MKTVIEQILTGECDEYLDAVYDAYRDRNKLLRQQTSSLNMANLKIGQKGTLTGLTPQYINGHTVEIVEKKRTRFLVKSIGRCRNRFVDGQRFTIPAQCFVKEG